MRDFHLITVGKLKEESYLTIEKEYTKRLRTIKLTIHECKSLNEDLEKEAALVIAEIQKIRGALPDSSSKSELIFLTEHEETLNSESFANIIRKNMEANYKPIFVISGGAGFSNSLLAIPHQKMSLSRLTFPHQMARVIFIEQLYRAQTLIEGHPYHK